MGGYAGFAAAPGRHRIQVGGVGIDSNDIVYVFNRGEHPMTVFDREGYTGIAPSHRGEAEETGAEKRDGRRLEAPQRQAR